MTAGTTVIVGGTRGLGRHLAERLTSEDLHVVITGRKLEHAQAVAGEIGGGTSALALDLTVPDAISEALQSVATVDHVVLAAIERDSNSIREYDIERAVKLATMKLVGYTEVLHTLASRLHDLTSVLLFGGVAKDRPYPGSTTVSSVNGAVTTMVRTFAIELAPIRVNAVHPGVVGDSPAWVDNAPMLEAVRDRTPTGRLVTMNDIVDASLFLLRNRSVNGVNLIVDGGTVMV